MDNVWTKLLSLQVKIQTGKYPLNTDKKYASNLMMKLENGNWEIFYQAIDALERGCGYSQFNEIEELCQSGAKQDDKRLLKIIEQKSGMINIVILLRCVDSEVKLDWIDTDVIKNPMVLFECLRQILSGYELSSKEQSALVKGLNRLSMISRDQFKYILNRYLLYRDCHIPVVSMLMTQLSKDGWVLLSDVLLFENVIPERMQFWDQCANNQNWLEIYSKVEPIIKAWKSHLNKKISDGSFGNSLYNDVSNILVTVLSIKLSSVEKYVNTMKKAIYVGKKSMYRWYESEYQQRGVLFANLSLFAHLCFVWMKNEEKYNVPFPKIIIKNLMRFISQWRFLWDDNLYQDTAQKEVHQIEEWIISKNTLSMMP